MFLGINVSKTSQVGLNVGIKNTGIQRIDYFLPEAGCGFDNWVKKN
jgi:hypothetical protein